MVATNLTYSAHTSLSFRADPATCPRRGAGHGILRVGRPGSGTQCSGSPQTARSPVPVLGCARVQRPSIEVTRQGEEASFC